MGCMPCHYFSLRKSCKRLHLSSFIKTNCISNVVKGLVANSMTSFQQFEYSLWCCSHFCDSAEATTHIFKTGSHKVHLIVDNEESVMILVR